MTLVLERSSDVAKSMDLRRELLAAGFVIEPWGDGARLVLSPAPIPGLRSFDRAAARAVEVKGVALP